MSDFDIDTKGLDDFKNELNDLVDHFPKEAKKLMRKSGSKARTIIARYARKHVKKKTGNYHKSIRRGKVWKDQTTGSYKVRVYSAAPHAHLIEYGHRIVDKKGQEHGFKEGSHVFEKSTNEVDSKWDEILEKEFDKIFDDL
ncbi:HK97 gp10 family phage protein [Chengkuizengella marina]|uniref:HK97 gp10 family phage protein n=1 Tax=Chengkuizengella marina TaxID=2507566 RepID=A0A6N9Q849_9BACL|nr:HK97 gp10 family phage protein [Chengkuizengella marina]NBI31038.1 HK97 gp10 family phage protein [Chengkuizengella marina]